MANSMIQKAGDQNQSRGSNVVGNDSTMLSKNPAKRISAQTSAGLNRREEVELTQFDKPVLDIERLGKRKQGRSGHANDISEELYFTNGSNTKFIDSDAQKFDLNASLDSSNAGLNSQAPYILTNGSD